MLFTSAIRGHEQFPDFHRHVGGSKIDGVMLPELFEERVEPDTARPRARAFTGAALNVSGSQASNRDTTCCEGPFTASCAGPATTAAGAFSRVEG